MLNATFKNRNIINKITNVTSGILLYNNLQNMYVDGQRLVNNILLKRWAIWKKRNNMLK